MRRFTVVGSAIGAIAMGASLAFVGLAGPVSASPATSSVACHKLSGSISSSFKVSSCSPANSSYSYATGKSSALASGKGTLTWHPSGKTTTATFTVTSKGRGGCAVGSTEYDVAGKVTGGTAKYTKVGDVVKARACVSSTGAISLVPKTVMSL